MKTKIIILIAVLLLIARVFIHPAAPTIAEVYKDAAHLFVGGLFVAWRIQKNKWQKYLFIIMCAWELLIASGSRFIW